MHVSIAAQTSVWGQQPAKGTCIVVGYTSMSQTETDPSLDPFPELPGKGLSLLHFKQQN